jgi:hypothetical protein
VNRKHERQRPDQMGRDPLEGAALAVGFHHQAELALLQVAKTAVNQSARPRAGSRPEIVLLHHDGAQSAHRRVARDSRAVDAAADHQEIGGLRRQLLNAGPLQGAP